MVRPRAVIALSAACALAPACGSPGALPPLGEALVVVDTDMPVPRIVGRLRVDVYSASGAWLTSRDLPRAKVSDWPTSFSVFDPDPARATDALVRLRAYPEGYTRDYRGERYAPRPAPDADRFAPAPAPSATLATADCPECPRLVDAKGDDVTPPTEPAPLVTIDRLVKVHLAPGVRGKALVVLRGACAGTQADLASGLTCVDAEGATAPVAVTPLDPDMALPTTTHAGEIEKGLAVGCAGAPRAESGVHDGEVCVPGGAFILGGRDLGWTGDAFSDFPERVALLPPFFVDRYEYSVARLRAAIARGYEGGLFLVANEGNANDPARPEAAPTTCTWSGEPRGREDAPLNCVRYDTARALCQFDGGDLPTEAQWEYVATVAGRAAKTFQTFATHGSPYPDCADVAAGRGNDDSIQDNTCQTITGYGTAPVGFGEHPGGDVSFGVVGLTGNVAELVLDAFASMSSNCWMSASLASPTCARLASEPTAARGSVWYTPPSIVTLAMRSSIDATEASEAEGFRCARSAAP